ncbi:uncharacterized, partial [Tachysurus ichikawai]
TVDLNHSRLYILDLKFCSARYEAGSFKLRYGEKQRGSRGTASLLKPNERRRVRKATGLLTPSLVFTNPRSLPASFTPPAPDRKPDISGVLSCTVYRLHANSRRFFFPVLLQLERPG